MRLVTHYCDLFTRAFQNLDVGSVDPVDFADAIRTPYDPLDTDKPSPASVEFVTKGMGEN